MGVKCLSRDLVAGDVFVLLGTGDKADGTWSASRDRSKRLCLGDWVKANFVNKFPREFPKGRLGGLSDSTPSIHLGDFKIGSIPFGWHVEKVGRIKDQFAGR